jgi:heme exporter protein D
MNWPPLVFMGGHGLYVWGSYALTVLALTGEVWLIIRRQKRHHGSIGANAYTDGRQRSL